MTVVASIQNWNNFSKTIKCLKSLLTINTCQLHICGVFSSAAFDNQDCFSELEMWQVDTDYPTPMNSIVVPKENFKRNKTVNAAMFFGFSMLITMKVIR